MSNVCSGICAKPDSIRIRRDRGEKERVQEKEIFVRMVLLSFQHCAGTKIGCRNQSERHSRKIWSLEKTKTENDKKNTKDSDAATLWWRRRMISSVHRSKSDCSVGSGIIYFSTNIWTQKHISITISLRDNQQKKKLEREKKNIWTVLIFSTSNFPRIEEEGESIVLKAAASYSTKELWWEWQQYWSCLSNRHISSPKQNKVWYQYTRK